MEKPRSLAGAVLMSLAMPGLGHIYCGRLLPAVLFWVLGFAGWASFLIGFAWLGLSFDRAFLLFGILFLLVWLGAAVDAGRVAHRLRGKYQLHPYNLWYFYLVIWILGFSSPNIGLYFYTSANLAVTIRYPSDFMRPTLLPGDRVLADRRTQGREKLRRGELVVAIDPLDHQTERLLRVVALGGDLVELGAEGLVVAGEQVARRELGQAHYSGKTPEGTWKEAQAARFEEQLGEARYRIYDAADPAQRRTGSWTVGPDQVFLLGDNRAVAIDSVSFGPIARAAITGKPFKVVRSKDPRTKRWRERRKQISLSPFAAAE